MSRLQIAQSSRRKKKIPFSLLLMLIFFFCFPYAGNFKIGALLGNQFNDLMVIDCRHHVMLEIVQVGHIFRQCVILRSSCSRSDQSWKIDVSSVFEGLFKGVEFH